MSIYAKTPNKRSANLYKRTSASWSNWVCFRNGKVGIIFKHQYVQFTIRIITISLSQYNAEETFAKIQNVLMSFKTKNKNRASLVAQWLRICLPMQGTRVRALVWEDPTCRRAAGSVSHNYWACASGACAPQQERPR